MMRVRYRRSRLSTCGETAASICGMSFPRLLFTAALLVAAPALAKPPPLDQRVAEVLASAPAGTRFGVLVVTADGREVLAIHPDQRFVPASNTKLFTTAAAYALLGPLDQPDRASGTGVALERGRSGRFDVVLTGFGDARLSSTADCVSDCLAVLADAVAAKTRQVGDVIGDDRWFPDERWSPGMSWNNIGTESGTGISALSLDDNALPITVTPTRPGQPPLVEFPAYLMLINAAVTSAEGKNTLAIQREVNGGAVRLVGTIPRGGGVWQDRLGIDDPAHYAAATLRRMLAARGVKLRGTVKVRHRPRAPGDDPLQRASLPVTAAAHGPFLARLTPDPLSADITIINKLSQNLHAELLLRRIGRLAGTGSLADGTAALRGVAERAGAIRAGNDFADGSGMSNYNRISPRAAVSLLRWAQPEPWGAVWRASLPVGGTDGTLRRRFAGTALEGKIFAKTGTLNATAALSGYLIGASGHELTFSLLANDVPDGGTTTEAMDAALLLIAGAN